MFRHHKAILIHLRSSAPASFSELEPVNINSWVPHKAFNTPPLRTRQACRRRNRSDLGDAVEDGTLFGDQISGRSAESMGVLGRLGTQTGPSIGRTQGIVPAELMGYGFTGNTVTFGIARGFRGYDQNFGGSLGGGIRIYSERFDRIIGANVFYDYDNSSGALFRQVGFGGELLGQFWDARANAYLPDAQTQHLLGVSFINGSQQFTPAPLTHGLTYSNLLTFGNSLRGADMEAIRN